MSVWVLAGVGFSTYATIEHGSLKNGMTMLGDMCDRVSMLEGEEASVEELQVDATLTDTVLMLTAVEELCQNRQKAIVSLQTSRAIHKVHRPLMVKDALLPCAGNSATVGVSAFRCRLLPLLSRCIYQGCNQAFCASHTCSLCISAAPHVASSIVAAVMQG
jgi:hypothetical protein